MSATLFRAGGALTDEHAAIYVERRADREALTHLRTMDYLLVIEPRQQGKTSLINHLMRHPSLGDVASVYVDVATPDRSTEADWYGTLCPRILRQLRRLIPWGQWPAIPQNSAGWRDFLWDVAAFATDAHRHVVVALDEIGAVTFPGVTEFFSVLRDVYNSRQAETEFRQLTFLLAGAFHPRDLIKDDKISPFNIAQRVRLPDFTAEQTRELVGKGDWPDRQATLLAERIHHWTDGQPYLTQLLCSYLGPDSTPADVDADVERLRREDENHLPPLLGRLNGDEKLQAYVEQILAGERIKFYPRENQRQAQLELLGVIKKGINDLCIIRNRIYDQVLMRCEAPTQTDESAQTELTVHSMPKPTYTASVSQSASRLSAEWGDMNYEHGLEILRVQLEQTNRYNEFNVLEMRLLENLRDEQLYGPSEQTRSNRARVIDQLNRLALDVLGLTFNDLSLGRAFPSMQRTAGTLSLVRELGVDLTPSDIEPPVQPRLQRLPFNELSWEQFEALCAAVVEANPLTVDCHLYGVQGDDQLGIDIVATQRGAQGNEVWAYQCKRYKEYTPGKLREAMAKMVYPADYYVLMLSIPATAALRQVAGEKPNVFLWDAKDIARKLKNYLTIVGDFFGTAWREAFCG